MEKTLLKFTNSDLTLFDASEAFLKELGIRYNRGAKTSTTLNAIAPEKKFPKSAQEALNLLTATYFVGNINSKTFEKDVQFDANLQEELKEAKDVHYKGMFVFAVDLQADVKLTRTFAVTLTRAFNRVAIQQPVVLFIRQNTKLSIATCERTPYKQEWLEGEKLGKVSVLMNVDCIKPHNGHIKILESMQVPTNCTNFDKLYEHWKKVFNTQTLTEKFYKELFAWFEYALACKNVHFPENKHLTKEENEAKPVKLIRLITRLLFVWFLKEKKINNPETDKKEGLVPDKIFDVEELKNILCDGFNENSETESEYYNGILQNLFFATLNNEVKSRKFIDAPYQGRSKYYTVKNLFRDRKNGNSYYKISHDEVTKIFEHVPFLNCGLFECLDKYARTDISYDVNRIFDGFSTKENGEFRACIPNALFFAEKLGDKKNATKGIVNILNEYVFTVEENTPLNEQVSLDPELLGKVFENLLAANDPNDENARKSARKSSGSYYTPREIVEYMVDESLIQHLKTKLNDETDETDIKLRNLISPNFEYKSLEDKDKFNDEQVKTILEALYTCKILDPACGSGAFPMGMLHQMVHIINQLDLDNTEWQKVIAKIAIEDARKAYTNKELTDEQRQQITQEIDNAFKYSKNNPDYARKLFIIQNCIFGVDIQPIAMMISKLRFFISLICEQDETSVDFNKPEVNFNINTLPNLETKFVAANSLLSADVRQYATDWTNDSELEKLKDELMDIRRKHFNSRTLKEKLSNRTEDEQKRIEIDAYLNKTRLTPNQQVISVNEAEIIRLSAERKLYHGVNMVTELVKTEATLFEPSTEKQVTHDINAIKRKQIDAQIQMCKVNIAKEQRKSSLTGFAAAVKQLTLWNPYDQIQSSPFFDSDWMFGVNTDGDNGFDIVIGNPPYVETSKDKYPRYDWNTDLYKMFFEICLKKKSSKKGNICFITPKFYMVNLEDENLRLYFSSKQKVKFLAFCNPFHNVVTENVITLLDKGHVTEKICPIYKYNKDTCCFEEQMPLDFEYSNLNSHKEWIIGLDVVTTQLLSKLGKNNQLGQISASKRGAEVSKELLKNSKKGYKSLIGTDTKKYLIMWDNTYIDLSHKEYKRLQNFFKKKLIYLRRCNSCLEATYPLEENYAYNKNIYGIDVDENKGYFLKFILGVINSKVSNFYYKRKFSTKKEDVFPEIQRYLYEQLPIPTVNEEEQQKSVIALVDRILSIKKNNSKEDTSTEETLIDILVFLLYNLTYDEVMTIEESLCKPTENDEESSPKKGKKKSANYTFKKLEIEEDIYTQWLTTYQSKGTLPSEEEMKKALQQVQSN